jgi:hypothetical protein
MLVKAMLVAVDPPFGEITFQYNPTKYSVKKTNQWKAGKQGGTNIPPLEFVQGSGRDVTIEAYLDDLLGDSIRTVVDQVAQLDLYTQATMLNATFLGLTKPRPPRVMLIWSNPHANFRAVISAMTVNYTQFHPDGRPSRATNSLLPQNPTSMGSAGMRTHLVTGIETLDTIAYKELGSASQWRTIAELNNIDDPLSIEPGQHLMIAPLR